MCKHLTRDTIGPLKHEDTYRRIALCLRLSLPDVSFANDGMGAIFVTSTIRDCVFLAVSAAGSFPIFDAQRDAAFGALGANLGRWNVQIYTVGISTVLSSSSIVIFGIVILGIIISLFVAREILITPSVLTLIRESLNIISGSTAGSREQHQQRRRERPQEERRACARFECRPCSENTKCSALDRARCRSSDRHGVRARAASLHSRTSARCALCTSSAPAGAREPIIIKNRLTNNNNTYLLIT